MKSLESTWSVRPEGERDSQHQLEQHSKEASLFWGIVVAAWGFYVMFM